eukprot:SAG22_NODE_7060_length_780_cov_2.352423_2_plen_158_part_01
MSTRCWLQPGYLFRFFWWLDLIAVASMLLEVEAVRQAILDPSGSDMTLTRAGRAAKAGAAVCLSSIQSSHSCVCVCKPPLSALSVTSLGAAAIAGSRAGRMLRMTRVLRLLRVLKLFRALGRSKVRHSGPGATSSATSTAATGSGGGSSAGPGDAHSG